MVPLAQQLYEGQPNRVGQFRAVLGHDFVQKAEFDLFVVNILQNGGEIFVEDRHVQRVETVDIHKNQMFHIGEQDGDDPDGLLLLQNRINHPENVFPNVFVLNVEVELQAFAEHFLLEKQLALELFGEIEVMML